MRGFLLRIFFEVLVTVLEQVVEDIHLIVHVTQIQIWYGCQHRIDNLRQGRNLGGGFVTHVACMVGKCGNVGSRIEFHAILCDCNHLAQL